MALLFLTAYLFLYTSAKKENRHAIVSRLQELSAVYKAGGQELLEENLRIAKKFNQHSGFLVRLATKNNKTLLLSLPYQWAEFDIKKLENTPPYAHKSFFEIPALSDDDSLVVKTSRLPDGSWLEVGRAATEQRIMLARFQKVLAMVTIPLIIVGLIGGAVLSYRALSPVRHLIQTVRSISLDVEKMGARIPNPRSNDEMEELVTLFNSMLEKIEGLITAMKNSLDHVAHDLKTPMTRLRGIAEIALQSDEPIEKCKAALADCVEESERILRLVDTVLDISEAETGVMRLQLKDIDLAVVANQILELYTYVAEAKSIIINATIQQDLWVKADSARIGQVVANIVDNAVKYTPQGGKVDLEAYRESGFVIIKVRDTGIGIPKEEIPRIWDRLYRGDKSRSEKGLGLGLTFVKAIVHLHKGRIEVTSTPGKGSTFTVYLPYSRPEVN